MKVPCAMSIHKIQQHPWSIIHFINKIKVILVPRVKGTFYSKSTMGSSHILKKYSKSLLLAGNLNFNFRIMIWIFFLRFDTSHYLKIAIFRNSVNLLINGFTFHECLTINLWNRGQHVVHVTPRTPIFDLLAQYIY